MAKFCGYAIIGLFFLGLGFLMSLKMGVAASLALAGFAVTVTAAMGYAIGLAITGDWQCWRDLIP